MKKYTKETDLVNDFLKDEKFFKKLLSFNVFKNFFQAKRDIKVLTELSLGYGIPDIVVVEFKINSKKRCQALTYFDLSILKILESSTQESLSRKEIAKIIGVKTTTRVAKSLKLLLAEEIITRKRSSYSFQKYEKCVYNVVAIEAKLHNWKRAIEQARRYKWFARTSYILLPESTVLGKKERILEMAKKHDIGLIVAQKNGFYIELKAVDNQPYNEKMESLLNEEVLRTLVT